MKFRIILILFLLTQCFTQASSQELAARVSVSAVRVSSNVDKKIFATLQNQLNTLLNNRKWTNDNFQPSEKIECSFLLNIENTLEANVYKATLNIQAARPVFNSTYKSAIVNFIDEDVAFKFVEFQPVEFNENRVQGTDAQAANLPAIFAYYAYMIIGLDYDSFSPKGGEPYFRKAQSIVTNAPEGRNISGWRVFDGQRNRYWLNENLINNKYNLIHDIIYSHYRAGLDKMYEADTEARANILQSLTQLDAFNKENANTMILPFLMQGKVQEYVGIFKKGTPEQKSKAVELLSVLDVVNSSRYKSDLR